MVVKKYYFFTGNYESFLLWLYLFSHTFNFGNYFTKNNNIIFYLCRHWVLFIINIIVMNFYFILFFKAIVPSIIIQFMRYLFNSWAQLFVTLIIIFIFESAQLKFPIARSNDQFCILYWIFYENIKKKSFNIISSFIKWNWNAIVAIPFHFSSKKVVFSLTNMWYFPKQRLLKRSKNKNKA